MISELWKKPPCPTIANFNDELSYLMFSLDYNVIVFNMLVYNNTYLDTHLCIYIYI